MTEERRLVSREELAAIAARDAELSPCDCGPKDRPLEKRAEGWFHRTYGTNTVHVGMTQEERDRRILLAALPQPATEPDHPTDGYSYEGCNCTDCRSIRATRQPATEPALDDWPVIVELARAYRPKGRPDGEDRTRLAMLCERIISSPLARLAAQPATEPALDEETIDEGHLFRSIVDGRMHCRCDLAAQPSAEPALDGLSQLITTILRKYGGTMKGRGDHDIFDALVRYRDAAPQPSAEVERLRAESGQ